MISLITDYNCASFRNPTIHKERTETHAWNWTVQKKKNLLYPLLSSNQEWESMLQPETKYVDDFSKLLTTKLRAINTTIATSFLQSEGASTSTDGQSDKQIILHDNCFNLKYRK